MSPTVTPFRIDVPQSELDDLHQRLSATRWPDAVTDDSSQGTAPSDLRRLVDHWAETFDWRAAEQRLNALDQVLVTVDGRKVHAIRAGTRGATPLLLVHGWPDGFLRFVGALPLLADRFELVVPSIPGFGFSDIPTERGAMGPANTADVLAKFMTVLGHDRFAVHGADIGSSISEQLTLRHPGRVIALHLGDVPLRRLRGLAQGEQTDAERAWTAQAQQWELFEGAYGHVQRTKPQTIAAGLNDSPAGLASWQLEKFASWSDGGSNRGDVFSRFSLDDLATNLTVYWVTKTAGSAGRYYFDTANAVLTTAPVDVPTGVALFPRDLLAAPRESAERWFRIERWTEMPRGGHFGPWEEPELWSAEVIAFADQIGI
jgi:pimeloyl-ACP methyl ester carboxylesterase